MPPYQFHLLVHDVGGILGLEWAAEHVERVTCWPVDDVFSIGSMKEFARPYGAHTRHEGVELSGEVPVGEQLTFAGWITYARHTYRFNDTVSRAGESITSGDDMDTAPRWIWNAHATWRPLERASLELAWTHMGEYFTNAQNTATYPGHNVFDLRGEYELNDDLAIFAAVRNLTNTDYAERADFAFGNDRYFPGEDRGVTIGFRARR